MLMYITLTVSSLGWYGRGFKLLSVATTVILRARANKNSDRKVSRTCTNTMKRGALDTTKPKTYGKYSDGSTNRVD